MSSVTLFPIPPPTCNNLEPLQRTRLLRSTRKLEALLGTTPYLLEQPDTPVSTGTPKARRRDGHVFGNSLSPPLIFTNMSPSSDSKSSPDSDGSFSLISPSSSLEHPLPPFELTLNIDDAEEMPLSSEKQKTRTGLKPLINKGMIEDHFRLSLKSKSKSKADPNKSANGNAQEGASLSPLPHTLVLCLRSLPVSQADARLTSGQAKSSLPVSCPPSFSSSQSTTQTRVHTLQVLNMPTSPASPTASSPLSPLSPTFYSPNHIDESVSERERERVEEKRKNKERDQRRKKIAKLTRTLGENVPPELVFPAPVPSSVGLDTQKSSNTTSCSSSPTLSTLPSEALERHPSHHRHENQGGTPLRLQVPVNLNKYLPESSSEEAGSVTETVREEEADGGRKDASPSFMDGQWPPSLAAFFQPPHSNSEEGSDAASQNTRWRPQYHKTHMHTQSSPSPSPVETNVFVKYDVFSDSHHQPTHAPAPAPPSISAPMPMRKRPSLSNRKPASTHKTSKSLGVVDEVFGSRPIAMEKQRVEIIHECGRRKERGWSGEWNRGDMDEVVKALRELKAR